MMNISAVIRPEIKLVMDRNFVEKENENFVQNLCYTHQKKTKNMQNLDSGRKGMIGMQKKKLLKVYL